MHFKFFLSLFCFFYCFNLDAFFLKKDIIPAQCNAPSSIRFQTTRALDNGSLKSTFLEQLKKIFQINVFVETGTYLGDTTIKAANIFEKVHTIELSQELYLKALLRLKPFPNVHIHLGSSTEKLTSLLPIISDRILIYLDSHYSGKGTARGSEDTPILKELQTLARAKKNDSIILIDDIRLFQSSKFFTKIKILNLGLEKYPDLKEVIREILYINPDYQICFLGDALLAFPKSLQGCISPVTRACALHRLEYLCEDLTEEELKEADLTIAKAESDEMEEIKIYYQNYASFELDYGYRSYATLWYALTLQQNNQKKEALALLENAAKRSLPNWRINRCIP